MKKYFLYLKIVMISSLFIAQSFTKAIADNNDKPGVKFRSLTLEQAIVAAKAENKKVFVHGFTDWCHYCIYMKDSVYIDKEVGDFFNSNFISLKIDMEKEGKEINKTIKSHTFPTFLFYDSNGELIHRAAGRRYKQPFMELGREALDPRRQMRYYKNRYDSATATPAEVQFYFRMQEIAGMDAQLMIDDYLKKQPDADFTNTNNWRIIYDIIKDPTLPVMQRILANKKEFESKYTADSINNKLINLYNSYLTGYVQKLDSVGFDKAKKQVLNTKGLDIAPKIVAYANLNKLKMKSDWEGYKVAGKKFVDQYAMDDFRRLLDIAQVYYDRFYTDKEVLAQAEQWALRSVSIADLYKGNHLLASISVMLGKKEQALKYATRAVEVAKQNNNDYKQTMLLLDRIQTMP